MKKLIPLLAALLLVSMLFPASAFAHGHGGSGSACASYALCTVEHCNTIGSHLHGNTWYGGHSIGDGHEHHVVCSVSGCTLATTHDHDGVTCFPHTQRDGHSYHTSGHRSGGRHH